MSIQLFKISKAGTHKAMDGRAITFAEADLSMTATLYPHHAAAPLVLGHPKDNQPALGTVLGLHFKGGFLYAEADASPHLVELVRGGRYKYVSACFNSPAGAENPRPGHWTLRHVGFLGSVPPAVKGLGAVAFSEPTTSLGFGYFDADLHTVSFAAASHSLPRLWSRQELHDAAKHVAHHNPGISYLDAVRILEKHA